MIFQNIIKTIYTHKKLRKDIYLKEVNIYL